jgi:hypothetical protein
VRDPIHIDSQKAFAALWPRLTHFPIEAIVVNGLTSPRLEFRPANWNLQGVRWLRLFEKVPPEIPKPTRNLQELDETRGRLGSAEYSVDAPSKTKLRVQRVKGNRYTFTLDFKRIGNETNLVVTSAGTPWFQIANVAEDFATLLPSPPSFLFLEAGSGPKLTDYTYTHQGVWKQWPGQ